MHSGHALVVPNSLTIIRALMAWYSGLSCPSKGVHMLPNRNNLVMMTFCDILLHFGVCLGFLSAVRALVIFLVNCRGDVSFCFLSIQPNTQCGFNMAHDNFEHRLTETLQKYLYQYDSSHALYKEQNVNANSWREIAEKLGSDPSTCEKAE
jgi:hypothetical protein